MLLIYNTSQSVFVPLQCQLPPIDLGVLLYTGSTPLTSNAFWRYLGFFFDRTLSFKEHVHFYATKSFTACKALHMLGNSVRGLPSHLKCLIYISCILPVMTYGYHLWFFKGSPYKGYLNILF